MSAEHLFAGQNTQQVTVREMSVLKFEIFLLKNTFLNFNNINSTRRKVWVAKRRHQKGAPTWRGPDKKGPHQKEERTLESWMAWAKI